MSNRTKYTISLNVMLAVAFALIGIILGATADAPEGGFVGSPIDQIEKSEQWANGPANVPTWTKALAREYPAFADFATKPADAIPADLVVVHNDGSTTVETFDAAWAINHDDERANDVFVVGGRW